MRTLEERLEAVKLLRECVGAQAYLRNYNMPNRLSIRSEYYSKANRLRQMGYPCIAELLEEKYRDTRC